MLKRKSLIFFTVLVAIAALFVASNAMAEWPDAVPMFKEPPPTHAEISTVKDGTWVIDVSLVPDPDCTPDGPCNQYSLRVSRVGDTCNSTGLNAVLFSTPYPGSCTIAFERIWVSPASNFKDEPDAKVFPYTPGWEWDSTEGDCTYDVGINSPDWTWGTVCLKINRDYQCATLAVPTCEIPDCPASTPLGASLPAQCVVLLNGTEANNPEHEIAAVYYQTDQFNVPIVSSIKFHETLNCSDAGKDPDSVTADDTVYSTGGPGQPNISFTVSISSPAFIEFWTGSYWVRFEY